MQQFWSEEVIAYMHDAMEQSDYYARIAARIAPHLDASCHLCDAGCGMGGLSLALAPSCGHITAIDQNPLVTEYLRLRAGENIEVLCTDMAAHQPREKYDAMAFCLFGSMEETLQLARKLCRGDVFLVKRDYERHRFSAGDIKLGRFTANYAENYLQERNIPFTAERFRASFDQPFRSLAAAERFFTLYNRSETAAFTPEEIAAKLVETGDAAFPYVLPNDKQLCLFRFSAQDIPQAE